MTTGYSDLLQGFDPAVEAETSTERAFVPVGGANNPAVVVAVRAYQFDDGRIQVGFQQRVTEGPNEGMQATLQLPLSPDYTVPSAGARIQLAQDDARLAAALKGWQAMLARVVRVMKLATPLPTAPGVDAARAWAETAVGAVTLIDGYIDKKGFGAVPVFRKDAGKNPSTSDPFGYRVGLRSPDEPARDRKGTIPGLTAGDQARAALAKLAAKAGGAV